MRKKHRMFGNRVLRKIHVFEPKKEEVTGVEKTTQEELYDLYPSTNIIRLPNQEE
jgi:hypothetical protein